MIISADIGFSFSFLFFKDRMFHCSTENKFSKPELISKLD